MNSLSYPVQWELHRLFSYFARTDELWICILTSEGDKAFCAGQDLKSVRPDNAATSLKAEESSWPPTGFGGISRRDDITKPIIAAVNGLAYGGGCELALSCDIIVAAEHAAFALPEVKRGLMPPFAASLLPRLIGWQNAMEMMLTGEPISAQRFKEMGVVNFVVPKEMLMKKALEVAELLKLGSPDGIRASKRAVMISESVASWTEASILASSSPEAQAMYRGKDMTEGPTGVDAGQLSKKQPWCDGSHVGTGIAPMKWTVPGTVKDGGEQAIYSICGCKYTEAPPYCDASHIHLPMKYLKSIRECTEDHIAVAKLCTACGFKPDSV
ncbi:hypothetical protein SmJEL517_g00665 [Synchytrium microbalum]|uniref:Iron-binding zinc finger CDGSH type domain-containing protein n=1 Tax=Synchytrium microbalum TaxID=1806994 RepID=A0A507CE08_9FUNG|nr:uncharacterized protein SmJEL517_g00665 [Synchytrium microbalum]TPX37578.1 hypothetical protein SmJEL517_g00665 [Synchytrium microbalum]